MLARQAKDLAIALEALSRIQQDYSCYDLTRKLLEKTLKQLEQEILEPIQPKPPILEDEIPF